MMALRRLTQAFGIALLASAGVFLVLEATSTINDGWRQSLARNFELTADPSWPLWVQGFVGFGLACLGVAMVAAQITPDKKGRNSVHEVYRSSDGDTRIRGRAAIRAVEHELSQIDGVVSVAGRIRRKTIHVEMQVDDRANLVEIEEEARERLSTEFWVRLGLADYSADLLVTHHPQPPRVR